MKRWRLDLIAVAWPPTGALCGLILAGMLSLLVGAHVWLLIFPALGVLVGAAVAGGRKKD